MTTLIPIDGYLVNPRKVGQIVSPAYDALTPAQRHAFATSHPENYLNVMRSREEFPENERPTLENLLASNNERLQRMISDGDFVRQEPPGYFIYRLAVADHVQTGLVAEISVAEYLAGKVKKHEDTQEFKEDDLTAYQRVVRASSSPICLTYPAQDDIDALIAELSAGEPTVDFVADDGARQSIWSIAESGQLKRLEEAFAGLAASYLTDGHHRAASAQRFLELERDDNPQHTGDESYNNLLVSFFPSNQLRILEYNRCIRGTNGHSEEGLLSAISQLFEVEKLSVATAAEARPRRRGEFAMYVVNRWYRLRLRDAQVPSDPVDALDVSILQDRLLAPVLGVVDPRTDSRMGYMSGAFDLDQLQAHCSENDEVGFAVYPIAIEDLMAVADAERVMPPKSTWFDPKLRSGIFLVLR